MITPSPLGEGVITKTPKTQKLISGKGKTSFDLQNDFNHEIAPLLIKGDDLSKEILQMFMPASFWEKE